MLQTQREKSHNTIDIQLLHCLAVPDKWGNNGGGEIARQTKYFICV